MKPKITKVITCLYHTIEAERFVEGVRELERWETNFANMHQRRYWHPVQPARADGFDLLHKVGDEALVFICETEDGRTACTIYPADPRWTVEQMHEHMANMITSIKANEGTQISP